ncbi:MAG: type II toxin-antitoxin system PemK/MazF family toxin [Oscillospiraceae bacterium]|nr:type II toxin-antitoxin system PemK/MazF family toxin [Oscillospiraceae bacterium]
MVKQGDIIKLDFNPTKGHEQGGYRPAVVISNDFITKITNIICVCPISNTSRDFPMHVLLDDRTETTGFIFCDHLKTVDLHARKFSFIEKLPEDILDEVLNKTISSLEKTEIPSAN